MRMLILSLLACGCATAQQPITPAPAAAAVSAPADSAWSRAIKALADRAIPVMSSDRASGLITSAEVTLAPADGKAAGKCPGGIVAPGKAQYMVRVAPAGDSTAVTVTARLTYYSIYGQLMGECQSSGVLERRLAEAVGK